MDVRAGWGGKGSGTLAVMAERARISDVEILKEMKLALAKFSEDVRTTISGVDSEVQRVGQWLTLERPAYWKHELRRREDKAQAAKSAIAAKQLARAPEPVSVAEERQIFARCQRHLEEGQHRAAAVKRWAPVWDREAQLYKSSCSGLTETLERDIPQGMARLERMARALEAYLRVTGVETADQLATGLDVAEGREEGEHRYAHLRESQPGWGERGPLEASPVKDLRWSGGAISAEEGVTVTRLARWGGAPPGETKVVLAWRTLEVGTWFASRLAGVPAEGDSGWYLGPMDRPEATGGLRATTVASLTGELPWLAPILGLAPGTLVVVKSGVVGAVLDEADRDAWLTGIG